jgi:hypothetical protein
MMGGSPINKRFYWNAADNNNKHHKYAAMAFGESDEACLELGTTGRGT